ncbi:MAG: hypothetical protein VKN72_26500 [Nostocales cyanobacterium 94392]|nr:hypothetical protein [Nostocales cyanobacterium 94392]
MKILKIMVILSLTLIASCSNNPNTPITSNTPKQLNNAENKSVTKVDKDSEYTKRVRENIVASYSKIGGEAFRKINLTEYLKLIDDSEFINAGLLTCKILNNTDPKDDKFDPRTMRGIAKDSPHPLVYTKLREYLDPKLKFPANDPNYISLSEIDKIAFLGFVPHLIAESILTHSTEYYCPDKKS